MYSGYSKSNPQNSFGVHTQINIAQQIENCINDIRILSLTKTKNSEAYLNAVQNLFFICNVYIIDDLEFMEEMNKFASELEEYEKTIRNLQQRNDFVDNVKEMKLAEFLFPALLRSLDRQHMLPRRTGSAII